MADIILVDARLDALTRWGASLQGAGFAVSLAEAQEPARMALRLAQLQPTGMVVGLSGGESVVDLRDLLQAADEVRMLLLVPRMPPRAAFAKVADRHDAVILSREEPPIVIASTVIAMLASQPRAAHG